VYVPLRRAAATNATEPAMMAPSSDKNSKDTKDPDHSTMKDDDATVVAETPTTKINLIKAKMMDLNIYYELPYRNGQSDHDDFKKHVQLLIAMTKLFDKSTLRIYDNKNKCIKSFAEPKWLKNKEYFEDHFNLQDDSSQRKTLLVHCVMTKNTIGLGRSHIFSLLLQVAFDRCLGLAGEMFLNYVGREAWP
jgi:hypothetical protein